MNKEQQQIIDEAYENYSREYEKDNSIGVFLPVARVDGKHTYRKIDEERFIGLCIYDETFSQKWGLKIEERELSLKEQAHAYNNWLEKQNYNPKHQSKIIDIDKLSESDLMTILQSLPGPTKLITITYKEQTIESYDSKNIKITHKTRI